MYLLQKPRAVNWFSTFRLFILVENFDDEQNIPEKV